MNVKPSQVEVDTRHYESNHGAKPRGQGMWAFHPNPNVAGDDAHIIWISDSYGQAKREAQRMAAAAGWRRIVVLS